MKSPWRQVQPMEEGRAYVAFASLIPARSYWSTGRLFKGSRAVGSQMERTRGVIGFSMLAEPLRRRYATLSVWADDDALRAFAATEPHGRLMRELAPAMAPTRFVSWMIDGPATPPSWDDAFRHLGEGGDVRRSA